MRHTIELLQAEVSLYSVAEVTQSVNGINVDTMYYNAYFN